MSDSFTTYYRRYVKTVNKDDPKQVELVRILSEQLVILWKAKESIDSDGILITTKTTIKQNPSLIIFNAAHTMILKTMVALGLSANEKQEIETDISEEI